MEPHVVYAQGRNAVWNGVKPVCPTQDAALAKHFWDGVRDARAEERLDADTEWDND